MTKTFELKELKCPACSKALAENLAKIEYIKEININYDRKEITIEAVEKFSTLAKEKF